MPETMAVSAALTITGSVTATVAYAALKESVAYGLTHSLTETLEKEDELQTRAGQSEDHAIAVQAFVNKEKPVYRGR